MKDEKEIECNEWPKQGLTKNNSHYTVVVLGFVYKWIT